jgi:Uma2 family endonuclease
MGAHRLVLTYRDYAALPDDGHRYELHDGALSVTPAPGTRHQHIIGELFAAVRQHVRARELGRVFIAPVDVILSDVTVLQPDLVYVDPTRAHLVTERGVEGPPTLVVEIISPSTGTIDRVTKAHLYARHGVPYFWLVDPTARTIEAFRLEGERYVLVTRAAGDPEVTLPPFADLTLRLVDLWA